MRGIFVILILLVLVYLNVKTGENIKLVERFKFETLDGIKSNSLEADYKIDQLENATTKFTSQIVEDTSHVREATHYLIGFVALLIAAELLFLIDERKKAKAP